VVVEPLPHHPQAKSLIPAVTAGAGTSTLAALRLNANADADVGTNYALFVDLGTSRFDGNIDAQAAILKASECGIKQLIRNAKHNIALDLLDKLENV
jgi:hypothetical protein